MEWVRKEDKLCLTIFCFISLYYKATNFVVYQKYSFHGLSSSISSHISTELLRTVEIGFLPVFLRSQQCCFHFCKTKTFCFLCFPKTLFNEVQELAYMFTVPPLQTPTHELIHFGFSWTGVGLPSVVVTSCYSSISLPDWLWSFSGGTVNWLLRCKGQVKNISNWGQIFLLNISYKINTRFFCFRFYNKTIFFAWAWISVA